MSLKNILMFITVHVFIIGSIAQAREYKEAYNPTVDMPKTDEADNRHIDKETDMFMDKGKMTYMRQEISEFMIPPYRGKHYEDMSPDTLDLAERAGLAIHGMTECSDPELDYEVYAFSNFYRNPPVLMHRYGNVAGLKYHEALPLLRLITGTHHNEHVDRVWMESTLKSIGPDGIYYWKTKNRMPWLRQDMEGWSPFVCWEDGTVSTVQNNPLPQFTEPLILSRIMAAMTIYSLRENNPVWDKTIKKMIGRLSELAISKEDYCYYPFRIWVPIKNWPSDLGEKIRNIGDNNRRHRLTDDGEPIGIDAAELTGRLVWGLTQYYKKTGYEEARTLAGKLVNYVRHHGRYYDEQGRYGDSYGPDGTVSSDSHSHFHCHAIGMLIMLNYAVAVGDRELIEYAKVSYEWARDFPECSQLVGWFPEILRKGHGNCETCCIADMITLAIKLTEASAGDYWDDVDRWTRNQFAECQITKTNWINRVTETLGKTPVADNETSNDIDKRTLGTFVAYSTGNDYGIDNQWGTGIANCCTGNAARTIYYIWQHILDFKNGRLRLNLLLNRASAWADVYSYIPYEGQVDIKLKIDCSELLVRVPEWIKKESDQVTCVVNGEPRTFDWDNRYVNVGRVNCGQTVSVMFPIRERTVKESFGGVDYTYIVKGNTVVSVNPPGKKFPLYQRDHYRKNKVRWYKVDRFVADDVIQW